MHAMRLSLPGILALALVGGAACLRSTGGSCLPLPRASAAGVPAFSNPLAITNAFFPFSPGGARVYAGREGGRRITEIEQQLQETRTFPWEGAAVECRVLRDLKFVDGACTEISRSYFAQADDGSVYYFGEVPEPLPALPDAGGDDPADTESNGWVVGEVAPTDPPGTTSAPRPTLFMPADPSQTAAWKPEDLASVVDETDRVVRAGVPVLVAGGRFPGCLQVQESSGIDPGTETKWYAPGAGVVRARTRGGSLFLQASTFVRR